MSKYAVLNRRGWWNEEIPTLRLRKWWAKKHWKHIKKIELRRRRGIADPPLSDEAVSPHAVAKYNALLRKLGGEGKWR